MATLGIPGGLILLPFGVPLAKLVFGPVWEEAGEAAMALSVYPAAATLYAIVSSIFSAIGRPQLPLKMHIVEVAIGAVAMFALLPFGLVGVAAGVSVGAVGAAIYGLRLVNRELGVAARPMIREIMPPVIAAVTMALVMLPVEMLLVKAGDRSTAEGLVLLAAEMLVAVLIYLGILRVLSPGRIGDFMSLLRRSHGRLDDLGPEPDASAEEVPAR